jgi:hypothetical protein
MASLASADKENLAPSQTTVPAQDTVPAKGVDLTYVSVATRPPSLPYATVASEATVPVKATATVASTKPTAPARPKGPLQLALQEVLAKGRLKQGKRSPRS